MSDSKRQTILLILFSFAPSILLPYTSHLLRLVHGSLAGRHNSAFIIFFHLVFLALFVAVGVTTRPAREARVGPLLKRAFRYAAFGVLIGYLSSAAAYVGVIMVTYRWREPAVLGFSPTDVLVVAAFLVLNIYGWLLGGLYLLLFDLARTFVHALRGRSSVERIAQRSASAERH